MRSCHTHGDSAVSRSQRRCENGDVRLRGGSSDAEGRVEVCINSNWGSICRGSSNSESWSSNDAEVVCKQLGFNFTETSELDSTLAFPWP